MTPPERPADAEAPSSDPSSPRLRALAGRVADELEHVAASERLWVWPRRTRAGEDILNTLIVGGGQSGLAIAFALRRERVDRVLVVDENPQGLAGPWLRFARMDTLRTPKELTGPDLGVPSLTFRAWYEAQHGGDAWAALGLIPRARWACYLEWYRRVLALPVEHDTRAGAIAPQPDDDCLAVTLRSPAGERVVYARTVVLASGIDGAGAWTVPDVVAAGLPRARWAHTHEPIDFTGLRGLRVAVLGAGASAFDNAAVALDHGAAMVDLFCRRPALVRVDAYRWGDFCGFLRHHHDLPDADRYRFMLQIARMGQLPPPATYHRVASDPRFRLHVGAPWQSAAYVDDEVRVRTAAGEHVVDFVIVGSGFRTDLERRPELAELAPHVARWRDRLDPPAELADPELLRYPYLGPSYEFVPRDPERAQWVSAVFGFNYGALLSHGFGAAGLTGFRYTVPRLVHGVTRRLYVEDRALHLRDLEGFDHAEF